MKIRRVLATAVAIAVTTPAVMLSVTPAFADTEPAAQPQAKPTVKELEKAAAEAQKAYDEAVAAEKVARKVVDEALSDSAPLAVAAKAARKAAEDAATAKTTADQAVTDAKAALDALPAEPTPEEKAAAEKTLAEAETAATAAATAKTTADAEARTAVDLADDARVAAVRVYGKAQAAVEETLAAKTAADAALARAKEEENQGGGECLDEPGLTTVVTGFPSKVTAGTATTFSVRVTNGTDKDMEKVLTYASVHATDKSGAKDIAKYLKLKWSSVSSPKWKTVDGDLYIDTIGALKRGEHGDIKLRLDVDAKAPAGQGLTFIAGDYFNKDGCGLTPDAAVNKFDIKAAAGKPTPKPDPKPTKSAAAGSGVTPQGSGSSVPVNTTNGSLAATGSSDATAQIALAGGAAVVLGAGAMFLVRRRRTGADV
ncbi:LAETG motif-containing sortase-dependent surface protein [Streptomyces microflavus]|uniref:LAETG motif-containing sortase-dependent surface protein n=1 Tax=Streptomyces microflavus TaxID=1919 RepID=A0A6N9VKC1_STRMI|nr:MULTISPECIES: LAETG motif-containing sortase-dependent surface protein [Streptomyces]MBK5992818.1 LPXTG cell wall anchor domain-containing protein [Streptomyces sp. MBT58]NEB72925.1 LPXTG cell wall anchor domain-containing protein [Streptomyces microflavus]NEB73354.1 LPXTG cell wall anchor domain-containing protein [Streptomyces microflavus]QQZ54713.1 LPXTG cell wall anchor domain-containing protein [Streptomyces microflavus]